MPIKHRQIDCFGRRRALVRLLYNMRMKLSSQRGKFNLIYILISTRPVCERLSAREFYARLPMAIKTNPFSTRPFQEIHPTQVYHKLISRALDSTMRQAINSRNNST